LHNFDSSSSDKPQQAKTKAILPDVGETVQLPADGRQFVKNA